MTSRTLAHLATFGKIMMPRWREGASSSWTCRGRRRSYSPHTRWWTSYWGKWLCPTRSGVWQFLQVEAPRGSAQRINSLSDRPKPHSDVLQTSYRSNDYIVKIYHLVSFCFWFRLITHAAARAVNINCAVASVDWWIKPGEDTASFQRGKFREAGLRAIRHIKK